MRNAAMCLLVLVGLIAVGCGKDAAQTSIPQAPPTAAELKPAIGAVGVVDSGLLCAKLGLTKRIEERYRTADQQLSMMRNEMLKPELAKQVKLQRDLDYAVRMVSKTRPESDQEALMKDPAVSAAAQAKFNFDYRLKAYLDQYTTALENYKRTLLENWNAIRVPAMAKVGRGAGVSIILPKGMVEWSSAEVDLTEAMEEHLKTTPLPELPLPPEWERVIVPIDKIIILDPNVRSYCKPD